jgi:putative oxidoreductase
VEYLSLVFRFFLASVFLLAGLPKATARHSFERTITKYRIVPESFSRPLSFAVPSFEIVASLLLAAGVFVGIVAGVALVVLLVFTSVIVVNLVRGREIDCGCFGSGAPRRITWLAVARNAVLATMATELVFKSPASLSIGPVIAQHGQASVEPGMALATVLIAIGATLIATLLGEARRYRFAASPFRRGKERLIGE